MKVVGRTALEQVLGTAEARARNGAAGALEEDARLTALFLWTLESTNGGNGETVRAEAPEDEDSEDDDEEEAAPRGRVRSFTLVYDVVRRFAQPLGIHLDDWKGRIVEIEKGVVRLLPVAERARQLLGTEGAAAVAEQIEREPAGRSQLALFDDAGSAPAAREKGRSRKPAPAGDSGGGGEAPAAPPREATTLDRVHTAMLLQGAGQATALRALLRAEQERKPDFLRLAHALSALYPRASEEKRLLDAMLLAVPR